MSQEARILDKKALRPPDVFSFKITAPLIAGKAKPGQFVIIRLHEKGERIPLSLAGINPDEGTITLIVMAVGKTTSEMATLKKGSKIKDLCGPLGRPLNIGKNGGRVLLVGGGFGAAPLYPIARAFKASGATVDMIMGARGAGLLIHEAEMKAICDKLVITTEDGSKGLKGKVTVAVKRTLAKDKPERVVAIGPAPMMKAVCEATRPYGILTTVSLNTIMLDGTGMCGSCRVRVGGVVKFACMDGPDFDGHMVDWDMLVNRQQMYLSEQKESFQRWMSRHARLLK